MNSKRKYTGEKVQTQTFIVNNPKPLDDRFVIQRRAYLIDPTTWYPEDNDDTNNDTIVEGTSLMAYSGMIVSVTDDPVADNNGLYILGKRAKANKQAWDDTDSSTYDADGWKKVDSGQPQMRTMNHEQLTDSSLGDINIHDGFYFPNAARDVDGNWYGAVLIGDQVWMAENLRTTKYADGTPIQYGDDLSSMSTPYYFYPGRNQDNVQEYGLLYNGAAILNGANSSDKTLVNHKGPSPDGWHIPSLDEFMQLWRYCNKQSRYEMTDVFEDNDGCQCITEVFSYSGSDRWMTNATGFGAKNVPSANLYNGTIFASSYIIQNASEVIFGMHYYSGIVDIGEYSGTIIDGGSNGIYGAVIRCVSDLTPVQFRNWYIEQYGSLQHHLIPIPTAADAGKVLMVNA